ASWPGIVGTTFTYTVNPATSFGCSGGSCDSAYAVYRNPAALAAGASRTYVTYYGVGGLSVSSGNLGVGISSPAALSVGSNAYNPTPFTANATITNTPASTATGVQASITLPAGLRLVSGETVSHTVGNMAAGA